MGTKSHILIDKSASEEPIFNEGPFDKWHAWCDLVFEAYFGESEISYRGVTYHSGNGNVYITIRKLANRWKWSVGKVQRFLKFLEDEDKVSITKDVITCLIVHETDQYRIADVKKVEPPKKKVAPDVPAAAAPTKAKTGKPTKAPTLVTLCRKVFESKYKELCEADYYWQAKDAVNMNQIIQKLKFARNNRNLKNDDEDITQALSVLLNTITDNWILSNFSVTNINSKYNEIVAQAKKRNGNGNAKQDRQQDALEVAQRLAERSNSTANEVF